MNKRDWVSVSPVEGSIGLIPTTGSHCPYSWWAFLLPSGPDPWAHGTLTPHSTFHQLPWDLLAMAVASMQAWVLGSQPQ